MGLGEAGLVAAVVFHAFNGIRIILVDFWSKGPRYQRQMFWAVVGRVGRADVPASCSATSINVFRRLMTVSAPSPPSTPPAPRTAAARPAGTNWELYGWLFMRMSGVLLVVLVFGHLFVNLVTGDGVHAIDFALRRPASGPARSGRSGTC